MNEPSFLLGSLAPGRGFVLVLLAILAVSLAVRLLIHRSIEDRFVRVTQGIERWVLTGVLLALVGLSAFQIIYRNVFGSGFVWIDPLMRSFVLWLTFLGAFAATAQGRHIGIDVVGRMLPERPRSIVARVLSVFASGVCVALANGAYEYLSLEREFEAEAFLGIPTWIAQSILLLGFVLLAYRFLVAAVLGVKAAHGGGIAPDGDAAYGGHASGGQVSGGADPDPDSVGSDGSRTDPSGDSLPANGSPGSDLGRDPSPANGSARPQDPLAGMGRGPAVS